ncbi:MAG: protoporphyrinogen oxidase HemJ [Pseudomonadota bacterium]
MIEDWLVWAYPYVKAIHIMAVISWMAGIFYLPRLFVYHAERAETGDQLSETLKVMEHKLMRVIMSPAMMVTWIFGLLLVFTPGIIDWSEIWPWIKAALVIAMTWFHHSLVTWMKDFAADRNQRTGRYYRIANEVPTLAMIGIVIMVVVRPF